MEATRLRNLSEPDVYRLLEGAGLKVPLFRVAGTAEEAARAAAEIGFPVVLKVASADVLHKSKVGGVKVDLGTPEEVRAAFESIVSAVRRAVPEARLEGCLVARQAPRGLAEAIVGAVRDAEFGRVVMFGVGGEFAEVLKCVQFRSLPLTVEEARRMVDKVRERMKAAAGWQRLDPAVAAELVVRFAGLVGGHPEIESIDLNPAVIYEDGYLVVDAKGTVVSR